MVGPTIMWQTARSVSLSALARLVRMSASKKSAQDTERSGVTMRQRVMPKKRRLSRKSSAPGKSRPASSAAYSAGGR